MTREQALTEARLAAGKAKRLAEYAEGAAHSGEPSHYAKTNRFAEAGALWADTSRAYAQLAQALPETADTDTTEG
ncbi:hypothetical protein [Streptomyces griseorubiginosus]|uniref:hypothetical protein n=1 Tax=Streptomyces griseorubiginosus TaxID=67304 RepID=UPI0036E98216